VIGVRINKNTKFSAASAPLREKINIISRRRRARRGIWGKYKPNIEFLGVLGALAREKTNKISRRRRVRRGIWGKYKPNIEVLGDLCALAREKCF
jgi:hypothetical protein